MPAKCIMNAGSLASATLADLKLAEAYVGAVSWVGRHSDKDQISIVFERADGGYDSFSVEELRSSQWWRFGDPDDVLSIEYLMRPGGGWSEVMAKSPVSYIARSDRAAGGALIPGSRLSSFFNGEDGYEAAQAACSELRAAWPDCRVFLAATVEEAERALQGVDVHAENMLRRKNAIRAEQAMARARLETVK